MEELGKREAGPSPEEIAAHHKEVQRTKDLMARIGKQYEFVGDIKGALGYYESARRDDDVARMHEKLGNIRKANSIRQGRNYSNH